MSSSIYSVHAASGSSSANYRPATIAELAARAQDNLWDPSKGLKHWLRTAERARKSAEAYVQADDYESAFVEYAKAATIVLEKLPWHREYHTLLYVLHHVQFALVLPLAHAAVVRAAAS